MVNMPPQGQSHNPMYDVFITMVFYQFVMHLDVVLALSREEFIVDYCSRTYLDIVVDQEETKDFEVDTTIHEEESVSHLGRKYKLTKFTFVAFTDHLKSLIPSIGYDTERTDIFQRGVMNLIKSMIVYIRRK
jgi:hypothetical protein